MNGATLFAQFALPPNELGYCGPADASLIEELVIAGDAGLDELRHTAEAFAGAWPYLQLIGACNRLDPLDPAVVEAYWIGNGLLDNIDTLTWGNSLDERFRGRSGGDFAKITEALWHGGSPTHAFHVFCVYPWVGLLRSGIPGPALRVLDRCRIRTGRVIGIEGSRPIVESNQLTWDGQRLEIGSHLIESPSMPAGSDEQLAIGDLVALHWDYVCQVLSIEQYVRLHVTQDQHLALANQQNAALAHRIEA
jgi:hypothetical protein